MLLAIDVGNSNISVGVCRFASDRTPELVCHFKFGTNNYSPDELSVTLEGFLRRFGILTADGTNDASAEYIGWLRGIMARDNVIWQTGELGKVDAGGGGTVAMFIAKHNIETVDLGVPVIAMHAPYEIIAKTDLYEAARAFGAFFR